MSDVAGRTAPASIDGLDLARLDVSDWDVVRIEKAATSVATWVEEPGTATRWLHKDTVIPRTGVEQGEDWSEVISSRVGAAMFVPCAETRLCVRSERRGSVSKNVRPSGHSLYNGYVLLEECAQVIDYFPHFEGSPGVDPARPGVKRPGHRIDNVKKALVDALPPTTFAGPSELDAFDLFAGYLLFDALVANRDRHEQNWAVLIPDLLAEQVRLAPSYDHASSLGYNLTDEVRRRELEREGGISRWAGAGTAWRYEHTGNQKRAESLVSLAARAVDECSSAGAAFWRETMNDLDLEPVLAAVRDSAIPEMSVDASTFACELLKHNLGRLNDVI